MAALAAGFASVFQFVNMAVVTLIAFVWQAVVHQIKVIVLTKFAAAAIAFFHFDGYNRYSILPVQKKNFADLPNLC